MHGLSALLAQMWRWVMLKFLSDNLAGAMPCRHCADAKHHLCKHPIYVKLAVKTSYRLILAATTKR